jgi:hypothetical protein
MFDANSELYKLIFSDVNCILSMKGHIYKSVKSVNKTVICILL